MKIFAENPSKIGILVEHSKFVMYSRQNNYTESEISQLFNMAGAHELGLGDLFTDSNMKIQSSMIYKALRGDGMRVRPLAKTRSVIGKSQTSPAKSESRPGSYKPEKGRVAAIRNMFELKATSLANDSAWTSKDALASRSQNHILSAAPKKISAFRKRELTPVLSEASTQRVPYRSTKLERPVSRASLKEDDCEKKPKTLRRTIDARALQKKSVPIFEILSKGKGGQVVEEKATSLGNRVPNRLGNRKRVLKRKRFGVTRRATVVAGKAVITRQEPPVIPRKEESKKTETGPKDQQIGGAASLRIRPKAELKTSSSVEISRVPSVPRTPILRRTTRNAIVREVVQKTRVMSPVQPLRKKLWLPTETRDSYNQFCPDTKAKRTTFRRKRPQRVPKKKQNVVEQRGGTANTMAKTKFDNTSDEESSEADEEEARMMEEMRKKNELLRKSQEFFNQFRYGEVLRKSMPEIRYTSEILAKSEAEVKRRLTEIEVRMRLSRLDESVSKINQFVPKWTSMLLAAKDVGRIENIQKTLTNAERIVDGKVDKSRMMLEKYLSLVKNDGHSPPTEEMETIETHSELVQLDLDSLERIFETYERQLQQELEEPSSISL